MGVVLGTQVAERVSGTNRNVLMSRCRLPLIQSALCALYDRCTCCLTGTSAMVKFIVPCQCNLYSFLLSTLSCFCPLLGWNESLSNVISLSTCASSMAGMFCKSVHGIL